MDPRKFLAPVECNLCGILLYSITDVCRHCSFHPTIHLICHHCLTNFDKQNDIAAHMNQKGAHLRLPYDPATYDAALTSLAPSTSAVLPLSQPAQPSRPVSPPLTDATLSEELSFDQLLRACDPSVAAGTDVSAPSVSPPQAVSSTAVSPTVGARPKDFVSYPSDEYVKLRQQNSEQKFLNWWCLHHLKSLPTPPPSAGGELDMALRRVLQQTALAPQFDQNSSVLAAHEPERSRCDDPTPAGCRPAATLASTSFSGGPATAQPPVTSSVTYCRYRYHSICPTILRWCCLGSVLEHLGPSDV